MRYIKYNQLTSYSNDNINKKLWILQKNENIPAVELDRSRRNYKKGLNNLHAVNEKQQWIHKQLCCPINFKVECVTY